MTLSITKDFEFAASHFLAGLPHDHKCSRLHGHSYRVRVEIWGTVDEVGFIIDFARLDWVQEQLSTRLDHRHLNDVLEFNPTSELISTWLLGEVVEWMRAQPEASRIERVAVGVSEGRTSWATATQSLKS